MPGGDLPSGRRRLGMITPSSNTVLEPVTYRLLRGAPEVSAHFERVRVTSISLTAKADAQFGTAVMAGAADLLADAKPDAIAWNGTSGAWLGLDHDRRVIAAIEGTAKVPATTSFLAILDAAAALQVGRLGIATPYTADVNARIRDVFASTGLTVVHEDHLGISDNESFGRVSPRTVVEQVRRVSARVDAVAVVCTNVDAAGVVEELEAELGIPVLDSVAVTLWKLLRLTGSSCAVQGFGRLLRESLC